MRTRRDLLGALAAGGCAGALPVTTPAATCSVPVDRESFQHYLDLFAAGDPKLAQYYADDVVLSIGARGELKGPRAILAFYDKLRENFVETFNLEFFVADAGGLAVEMSGSYRCIQDIENSAIFHRSIKKGEVRHHRGMVMYTLEHGKFSYIRGATPQITSDWQMES